MSEVQALAQRLKTLAYIVLLLVVAILILVSLYLVTYMNYVNLVHHYTTLLKACNATAIHLPTTP
jgi:flagellar biosynthesis/type III secretory pathway M-ring protein FliF/YscJ